MIKFIQYTTLCDSLCKSQYKISEPFANDPEFPFIETREQQQLQVYLKHVKTQHQNQLPRHWIYCPINITNLVQI